MTIKELSTVFDKVCEQTNRRVLKWRPIKDGTLRVDFPRSSVEIQQLSSAADFYALFIYNNAGAVVATVDQTFSPDAADKLLSLYKGAYEIAFELDETVADILGGLSSGINQPTAGITPGIYVASFTALNSGTTNSGLAVIADGSINGGDDGYTYSGLYELNDKEVTTSLKIARWNVNAATVFGTALDAFQLDLRGTITPDAMTVNLDGVIFQDARMKLKVVCRRVANAAVSR